MKEMPTKSDARNFGSTQYIDNSFKAKGVTPEDVAEFCDGHISEKVRGPQNHARLDHDLDRFVGAPLCDSSESSNGVQPWP